MYSDESNLISGYHSDFRKGYSTLDNIILVHILSQNLIHCKKNFFVLLLILSNVWREGLWFEIYKVV